MKAFEKRDDEEYSLKRAIIRITGFLLILILVIYVGIYTYNALKGNQIERFDYDKFSEMYKDYPEIVIYNVSINSSDIYNKSSNVEIFQRVNYSFIRVPNIQKNNGFGIYFGSNLKGSNPYKAGEFNSLKNFEVFKIDSDLNFELRKYVLYIDQDSEEVVANMQLPVKKE